VRTKAVAFDVKGLACGLCIGEVLERVHAVPGAREVSVGPVREELSRVRVLTDSTTRFVWLVAALALGGLHVMGSQGASVAIT
jgi:copper chaperone CopZ